MAKGIFVSRDWLMSVPVGCEIIDFCAVKCGLFYAP